ncbi:hypothetical protein LLF88_07355 [bacterium]|nr:hypothetical protein [bacterium]
MDDCEGVGSIFELHTGTTTSLKYEAIGAPVEAGSVKVTAQVTMLFKF